VLAPQGKANATSLSHDLHATRKTRYNGGYLIAIEAAISRGCATVTFSLCPEYPSTAREIHISEES